MDIDIPKIEQERSTRAASVLSGMSAEDMEAAETLNSLQQSKHAHCYYHERPRLTKIRIFPTTAARSTYTRAHYNFF